MGATGSSMEGMAWKFCGEACFRWLSNSAATEATQVYITAYWLLITTCYSKYASYFYNRFATSELGRWLRDLVSLGGGCRDMGDIGRGTRRCQGTATPGTATPATATAGAASHWALSR